MKKIYACKNTAEAEMIISLLKEEGLGPLELQTSSHVSVAGADIFYYVQAPEDKYEIAKDFLIDNGFKEIM